MTVPAKGAVEETVPDVSTDAGFLASLERDLGESLVGELEIEPTEVSAIPEGAVVGDEGDNLDAESGDEETDWKAQYDELQKLVGRQSNELGELRKQVSVTPEEVAPPPPATLITSEVVEQIESAIEESGGEQVAYWAATQRPDLYEAVLDAWSEQGGAHARRAAEFNIRYQTALEKIEQDKRQEADQSFATELESELDKNVNALKPEYGFAENVGEVDKLLSDTLENSSAVVKKLVVSKDPDERDAGLRAVFAEAARKANLSPAESPADKAERERLLAAAKGGASAIGGGLRPAQPAPVSGDEGVQQALVERMLKAPSTSIAEGLTFGNK